MDAMMDYVYSPDHQKVIDLYDVLGEVMIYNYESDKIPTTKNVLDN